MSEISLDNLSSPGSLQASHCSEMEMNTVDSWNKIAFSPSEKKGDMKICYLFQNCLKLEDVEKHWKGLFPANWTQRCSRHILD